MIPMIMNPMAQNPAGVDVAQHGAHGEQPAEASGHDHFGVGEIDQPEDAVDEGITERYERVKETIGEAAKDERDPDVVVGEEPGAAHTFRGVSSTLTGKSSQLRPRGQMERAGHPEMAEYPARSQLATGVTPGRFGPSCRLQLG